MENKITVCVADADQAYRTELCDFLKKQGDICLIGDTADGREALEAWRGAPFDLLLLDISMPKGGGIGALARIMALEAPPKVAMLTASEADEDLMQALKLYKLDNQRYPTGEQGLEALVAKPSAGPIPANWKNYLEKLPNDPWGRPYQYANPGVKSEIDVFSLGADGQAGGEGKDADIGSWQ